MRGRSFRVAPLVLSAAALAACGSSGGNETTPAACLTGPDTYLKALAAAPGAVRLQGTTAISDCLVSGQAAGELTTTGGSIIVAATRLNAAGRREPSGPAPLQLGYLVGAVQRGAGDTGGIHADLVRRLDHAARFSQTELSPAFERGFEKGTTAGQASG
jgi:hypothetical protein